MNKNILPLINDIILTSNVSDGEVNGIHWQTDKSKKDSVLFYNITNEDVFRSRIKAAKYKILIVNKKVDDFKNCITVDPLNFLEAQKRVCDLLFEIKPKHLIGVTGTNGKTTTVQFISEILSQFNFSVLTIGTLGIRLNGKEEENLSLTTPSYIDIRKILDKYEADFCIAEVSSHALDQDRFYGMNFDSCGWTNLTQDHLDYHETMENYFQAKRKIIHHLNSSSVCHCSSDMDAFKDKLDDKFVIHKDLDLNLSNETLNTSFNKKNITLAVKILSNYIDVDKINFDDISSPEGRFHLINIGAKKIIIDFAHTPDALENVCSQIKDTYNKKLCVVFGCGGDRDKNKRPLMARAVKKFADKIIVTSDNPRFEDPIKIIDDIVVGLDDVDYHIEVDRAKAIEYAVKNTIESDIILVAGKGHENYIDQNGKKTYFSDAEEVLKYKQ